MNLLHRNKPVTTSGKVLQALKKAGHHGLYNYELNRIAGLSWHRRLGDLRFDGYNIQCVRMSKGSYKYYYNGHEDE